MMKISYSPEALDDLKFIKEDIENQYGKEKSTEIIGKIAKNVRNLEMFPNSGVNLEKRWGIVSDYQYIYAEKNYIFYRIEEDYVRVIRVLNEREDFMRILFGIVTTSEDTEEYWKEQCMFCKCDTVNCCFRLFKGGIKVCG